MHARLSDGQARTGTAPRLSAAAAQSTVVASLAIGGQKAARIPDAASTNAARFDAIVKQAELTSEKLASLFKHPSTTKTRRPTAVAKTSAPVPERFASLPAAITTQQPTMLAYASSSPTEAAGAAALSALLAPHPDEDLAASQATGNDTIALPDFEDTPSDAPMPQLRPGADPARKAGAETGKPDSRQAEQPASPKADEPRQANERETQKPQQLAYARPNDPADKRDGGGIGRTLRNLFGGGTKPGNNGVAVYDISAAKVYMPDGTVLEAHSGVGKMADDPRYVHVKMNGPTPPHTYNLRMRESRFHGVEAIRMLPADGKNKFGRDGFLTHSYLLRGRQGQSHGCVAFKDYDRFLTAFKQGKVKQIVVVPNGGHATMLASNSKRTL